MLAVSKPQQRHTKGDVQVKSSRERMEIVNAYAAVGSYRGAAALCGTTHKTVKRVLERLEAGHVEPRDRPPSNTAGVVDLIAQRVQATDGRISAKPHTQS